jgi:hypothetical protein
MGNFSSLINGPGDDSGKLLSSRRPNTSITYPSPFFDVGNTYLPRNIKALFQWCRYYYYTNPVVHRACNRLSRFPITEFIFETDDQDLKQAWENLFREARARQFAMDIGLDLLVYGNAFCSIYYPILRMLHCPECQDEQDVKSTKAEFKNYHYRGKCRKCGHHVTFKVKDTKIKDTSRVNLLHWAPENMDIDYNDITASRLYTYNISKNLKRMIRKGRRPIVDDLEMDVIRHVKEKKSLRVHPKNIYHLRSSVLAATNMAWGFPDILACLKTLFLQQIYLKARETAAYQHIIPLWILFPQANADITPFESLDMSKWRDRVETEIGKWKRDPNYISVMPIPLGFQFIGADFQNMQVIDDIEHLDRKVLAGMGTPEEFIYGGVSWSATSISARMLENDLYNYVVEIEGLFNDFIIPRLAEYTGLDKITIRFKPIKMVDDVQQKGMRLDLAHQGRISWETILEELGYDWDVESEKIRDEQEVLAEITGKLESESAKQRQSLDLDNMRHQMRLQIIQPAIQQEEVMEAERKYGTEDINTLPFLDAHAYSRVFKMDEGGTAQRQNEEMAWKMMPFNPPEIADTIAAYISGESDDSKRTGMMNDLQQKSPSLYQMVMEQMNGRPAKGRRSESTAVDMRPNPEQKPPRRTTRSV